MSNEPTFQELKEKLKHESVDTVLNEITEKQEENRKMTPLEQATLLTAMQKAVKTRLDDVRADVDEEMIKQYQADGTDRKSLKLGNNKVGTISIRMSKAGYQITDREIFENYLLGAGYSSKRYEIKSFCQAEVKKILEDNGIDWHRYFDLHIEPTEALEKDLSIVGDCVVNTKTGEVVDGVEPMPERPIGTTIRGCKPEEVLPIALSMPAESINNLLIGEVEND